MYCPKCGGQIQFGKQKCPKCGAPLFGNASAQSQSETSSGSGKTTFWDKIIQNSSQTSMVQKPTRTMYNIIWFAMFFSLAMYIVVLFLVNMNRESPGSGPFIMLPILCAVALSCSALGFLNLKMQLVQEKILKLENKNAAAGYIQTAGIISLALFESVAIYGLVLNFVGFSKMTAYPFFAVSALLLIYSRTFTDAAWNLIETHPKFASEKND